MRTSYIDPEAIERLRANMGGDEWLTLWVALETGMRIGDIVLLRGFNLVKGQIEFTAQKTGKIGKIPVSKRLFAELSAKTSGKSSAWVFPSPVKAGQHITRQCVWQRVKRACKRAGVDSKGIAPHSFRKSFAVELFKREGLEATREALQHDRASTTQLYALSDFTSGSNGDKPLLRRDLPLIVAEVLACLGQRTAECCK